MQRIVAVAVLMMVVISVLGGATSAGAQNEDEKVVLRIGSSNDIDGFNPFKIVEVPSYEVMNLTYDTLVNYSPKDSSPVPGLADSWETSEDGLTWTFHLNEEARWHDGEDVTSEDVAYTFQRILDEKQGLVIDYVRQIESIETPDEQELTDKILQGEGLPGSTLVPPALATYHLDLPDSEIQGFDIERSRQLLEEAGWRDTNGNGTVDKDGEELQLRLFVRSEDKDSVTAG